jgi:predicted RNase H-like HicB family nuclease
MLNYPVHVTPGSEQAVMLTFPDVPEAVVVARCADEAFRGAARILEGILAAYVIEGRPIPAPSEADGAPTVGTRRFSLIGVEAID